MNEITQDDDENFDVEDAPTLFKLTGVDTSLGDGILEGALTNILKSQATLLETDADIILFCCHETMPDDRTLENIQTYIKQQIESPTCESILKSAATASVSIVEDDDEDECVEYITEEEAYQLWLEQNQDTDDLDELVSSPDGTLIQPKHQTGNLKSDGESATTQHLQRDPGLFEFDNVERVHYAKIIECVSSNEAQPFHLGSRPIVINGFEKHQDLKNFSQSLRDCIRQHDTIVRTGNRETLVANGFHNSKPATLSEAVDIQKGGENKQDGTIVFNPIHELPSAFRENNVLGQWIDTEHEQLFPNKLWTALLGSDENAPKFTLCMAHEGFGIGMHKHGPALFFLTEGRKKWYLSDPKPIDDVLENTTGNSSSTHPGFYQELSSHKCIQEPGELLLVPNLWYHEIYNLASPTIGIQALADELPVPGTLLCTQILE